MPNCWSGDVEIGNCTVDAGESYNISLLCSYNYRVSTHFHSPLKDPACFICCVVDLSDFNVFPR